MKPKFRFAVRSRLAFLAIAFPACVQPLSAASIFWANSGTDFNAGASWIGGTAPGAADIATFAGAKTTDPVLSAPTAIRGLAFSNATASSYTLSGASTLTLGIGGIDASAVTSGTNTITAPLTLASGGQTWSAGTGSTLAVSPNTFTRNPGAAVAIDRTAGGGTIATNLGTTHGILGPWAAVLSTGTSANNSASGATYATVSGGNIVPYIGATAQTTAGAWGDLPSGGTGNVNYDLSSAGTLGATGLNRNVNTIRYTGTGATQRSNTNSGGTSAGDVLTINGFMNAGTGEFFIGGTGGENNFGISPQIGAANSLVLAPMTANITIRGRIRESAATGGALTIAGNHTVTLTNAVGAASSPSTHTGPTTIAAGTLNVTGTHSINTSSGIAINGANAKYLHTSSIASTVPINLLHGTLDGTGTVGPVTVADNSSATITHGNTGTTPLTVGSLTFQGDAALNLKPVGSTPLAVTGALTTTPANGQVVLSVPGALPNGLVNLISFGSYAGDPAADFTANLTGLTIRQTAGTPQLNGSNIAVNVTGETIVWTGASDFFWETFDSGDDSGLNNWARKTAKTATNFWAGDTVEFNDTYDLGAGPVPVSEDYIDLIGDVSPISTTFNNTAVDYTIDSNGTGIATGSLTKNGTGTTTLLTANTYTGPTIINAGTLQLGDATIDGTISNTSSVTNNGTLVYDWSSNRTAAYPIAGSGGLVKQGPATLTLTGANTSTGTTTITEGGITLTGNGGIGTGALHVAAGAALTLNKTFTLAQTTTGAGIITNTAGTTTLSGDFSGFTGTVRHGSATSSTLIGTTAAASANAAYEITVGNVVQQGILALTLTGTNTLTLGSLSGVANSLVRNGADVTGTNTFQIGNLNTDTNFAGQIGGAGGGGTVALTKVGTGTLTLSGPAVYTGPTNVNQGTLALTNTAKALGSSAVTVANGAGLRVRTPAAATTTLTSASLTLGASNLTFDVNNLVPTAPQISTGALTVNGSVSVNIANATALATGTYKLIDYTSISGTGSFPGGSFPVGNRGTATLVNNIADTSIDLQVSSDTPVWTGLDNGNWMVGSTGPNKNWKLAVAGTPVDYIEGDIALFDDSALGTTNITVNTNVSPLSTTFNNSAKAYTVSGTAGIASGPLTKSGTGTVTLLTANTYTGATTINAGTLQLGNGTTDGTIANTASVANNGTLAYNWAENRTAAYVISGSGNLTKAGAGNLTLTGNNTYAGGTSLTGGTITLAGTGTLGSGTIAVGSNTTLQINKDLAIANTVTGAGSIVNTAAATITGNFTGFSGTYTHNSTLVSTGFGNANTTSQNAAYVIASEQGATQGMIANGDGDYTLKLGSLSGVPNSMFRGGNVATGITTLEIGNLGTNTGFAGIISNGVTKTIALTKVGSGTLTLSGASSYTGATLVLGGTLNVTGSLGSASVVTVASGTTLMGSGTVAGTVIASGTIAPGTSAGTLTTGPLTLSGTLAIEIDGATGDKLVSTGAVNLNNATLTVAELAGGFTQASYVIAEGTSITGSFANVPAGYTVTIVDGGPGKQAVLTSESGGGYDAWKSNVDNQSPDLDFNHDGVDNGIAYFMNNTGRITLPGIVGGTVTWTNGGNIPASAYGTQFVVQTSNNLTSWTNVPAGSLTANTNGPAGSLTYTVPTGQGKIFVRLAVDPQ